MSFYTSFAIIGYGTAGALYAEEILSHNDQGYKLRILTRSADKPAFKELKKHGVSIIRVDYSSEDSIRSALEGADIVLSALRDDGLEIQDTVIRAAKAAGIKLYVPSEYGRDTIGFTEKYLKAKSDAHVLLRELNLPYTLFFTGIWPEILVDKQFALVFGIDWVSGKFSTFGDGNRRLPWTSPRSFIPFACRLLTTLPPTELEWKSFDIVGEQKTFKEIFKIWEVKSEKKADIHERTEEEIQAFIDSATTEVVRFFPRVWQHSDTGGLSGKSNYLWPEWKPLKWEELLVV